MHKGRERSQETPGDDVGPAVTSKLQFFQVGQWFEEGLRAVLEDPQRNIPDGLGQSGQPLQEAIGASHGEGRKSRSFQNEF